MTLWRRSSADPLARLVDTDRVAAVDRLGVAGTGMPELDDIARRAARLFTAPSSIVSLFGPDHQYFPGIFGVGGGEFVTARGGLPYDLSYCPLVLVNDPVLEIGDARRDRRVRWHRATTEYGVRSYLGAPLRDREGHVVGALCVYDSFARSWTATDRSNIVHMAGEAMRILERVGRPGLADVSTAPDADESVA